MAAGEELRWLAGHVGSCSYGESAGEGARAAAGAAGGGLRLFGVARHGFWIKLCW